MNKRVGIIYLATDLRNGKKYVGKTVKPFRRRITEHYSSKNGMVFDRIVRKYGIENFKWEIIESDVPIGNLSERETYYILQHNSCVLLGGHGYNMTLGGDGAPYGELNPSCWPEVKEMRRLQIIGDKNPSKRLDVREKISRALTGRELTEEHKKSISSGLTGHKGSAGSNNPTSKRFIITHPNGITENIKGLREFCRRFNLNAKLMRRVANGRCENHKGYKCQYDQSGTLS